MYLPRVAGATGFLRIFPANAVSIATIFLWVEGNKEKEAKFCWRVPR